LATPSEETRGCAVSDKHRRGRGAHAVRAALLLIGASALAAIAALLLVLWVGGPPPSWVRGALESVLAQQLDAEVEIASIARPVYPELRLRNLSLRWPGGGRFEVRELRIDYAVSLAGFLAGEPAEIRIDEIRLIHPTLSWDGALPGTQDPDSGLPEPEDSAGAAGFPQIRFQLDRVSISEGQLAWDPAPQPPVRGPALSAPEATHRISLSISGRASEFDLDQPLPLPTEAEAKLDWAAFSFQGRQIAPGAANLSWSGRQLEIDDFRGTLEAARLAGEASIAFSTQPSELSPQTARIALAVSGVDLARLSPLEQLRSDLQGEISAEISFTDTAAPQGQIRAELRGPAAGLAIDEIALDLRFSDRGFTLESAIIDGLAARLRARSASELPDAFRFDLEVPDLSRLELPGVSPLGLSGRLSGEGVLGLVDGRPEGWAELTANPIAWSGFHADQLTLRLEPAADQLRGTVSFTNLGGVSGRTDATLPAAMYAELREGTITWTHLRDLSLEWTLRSDDIGPLLGKTRPDWPRVHSQLESSGRLRGLEPMRELEASLALRALSLTRDDATRLDTLTVREPISLDLQLALAGPLEHSRRSEVPRGQLPRGSVPVGEPATRSLSTKLSAKGPLGLELLAELGIPFAADGQLPSGDVDLRKLELTRRSPQGAGGVLTASGSVGHTGELDLGIELRDLALGSVPWSEWLAEPPQLGGDLRADLRLRGPWTRPELDGKLVWSDPRVEETRADQLEFRIASSNSALDVVGELDALGIRVATVQARIPRQANGGLSDEAPLGLSWRSTSAEIETQDLDVALLDPLLPRAVDAPSGKLRMRLEAIASGTGAGGSVEAGAGWRPEVRGRVDLREGSLSIPALRRTFAPISGTLHFSPKRLSLEALEIANAGAEGRATLTGYVELEQGLPGAARLDARFETLQLADSRRLRFALDGQTTLRGPLEALEFSGKLSLRDARLGAPEESDPIWREVRVLRERSVGTQVRETPDELARAFTNMRGSLALNVPAQTWVRAQGAELELVGQVELRKRPGDVARFFGNLDVRRGRYQFGPRLLVFERGSATLTGAAELDPLIDVLTTTRIQEYDVSVGLNGRLSNLQLSTSSSPSLERDDVLSLLLFGRRRGDLEASRAKALQLALTQLGSELGGSQLQERLRSYLPFDTFAFEVGPGASGSRFEVGRYIRDDIFVRYGKSLATDRELESDQVSVEWEVTPSVSIKSETSTDGSTGADIIWQKDY